MASKGLIAAAIISVSAAIAASGFALYSYGEYKRTGEQLRSDRLNALEKKVSADILFKTYGGETKLYKLPNSVSEVIKSIPEGTDAAFMALAPNGFYRVRIDGEEGYIKSSRVYDPSLPVPTKAPDAAVKLYVTDVSVSLMLREKPDIAAKVIDKIPLADTVERIGEVTGEFARVRYNGKEGYVYAKYLTEDATKAYKQLQASADGIDADKESAEKAEGEMLVTGVQSAIYLRAAADDEGEIIGTIALGESVNVIENAKNGYYKVEYKGKTGYSKSKYLKPKATPAPTKAVSTPSPNTGAAKRMTVTGVANSIYLRAEPDENGAVICEIPLNAAVEATGTVSGEFTQVVYEGKTGYSKSKYLK